MSDHLDEAVEFAVEKSENREEDVMIYENEGSGVIEDYVVTLSRWGTPTEFPEIDKTYKVIAEVFYEDGNTRIAYAPSVNGQAKEEDGDDIYEGREVYVVFEDGGHERTHVVKVSDRQIETENGMKFKKSDLTAGWGTEPSELALDLESFERESIPEHELEELEVGDEVLNTEDETLEIQEITSRQIKTNSENYRKRDGKVWGGGEKSLIKKL
jgi:hypothetical protein